MASDERRVTTFFRAKIKEVGERGEKLYFRGPNDYDLVLEAQAKLWTRKVDLCGALSKSYRWSKHEFVIQEVDVIVVSTEDYKPK